MSRKPRAAGFERFRGEVVLRRVETPAVVRGVDEVADLGPGAFEIATGAGGLSRAPFRGHIAGMLEIAAPPILPSILRGLRERCPECGEGRLFYRYLKVSPTCPRCGHDLDQYPSDDGPAYFTILLVGHLIVLPTLLFPFVWRAPVAIVIPIILIPLAGLTLLALPRVKGAVIGLLFALRVRRQDAALHTADRFE